MRSVYIHRYNRENDFINEFSFLPANEPNAEWYSFSTPIKVNEPAAWVDMEGFFTAIYTYVHDNYSGARVFTPPMAQNAYAETYQVLAKPPWCQKMFLTDGTNGGYLLMKQVFLNGTYHDGYAWNNYWVRGDETWAHCRHDPPGQHVAYFFPTPMQIRVAAKDSVITEADLASPTQGFGNPLDNKDEDAGREAARSLNTFLSQEKLGDYAAVWALNIHLMTPNPEQNWHEAYRDGAIPDQEGPCERAWFREWWGSTGGGAPTCAVPPTYTPTPLLTDVYDYPDPFSPGDDQWQDETFIHCTLHQTATVQVMILSPDPICYHDLSLGPRHPAGGPAGDALPVCHWQRLWLAQRG